MIRPLRQRHRRIFAFLAVILPAAFVVGIAARKPVPVSEPVPAALAPEPSVFRAEKWSREDLFFKTPMRAVLLREHADAGRLAVQFTAPAVFVKPDLLVYWARDEADAKKQIAGDAVLLGAFDCSSPLAFPSEPAEGVLVLYSLADGEIVDVSKPFSIR